MIGNTVNNRRIFRRIVRKVKTLLEELLEKQKAQTL